MSDRGRAALVLLFRLKPAQVDALPAESARWLLAVARMP